MSASFESLHGSAATKSVVIVEDNPTGHRLMYVRHLALSAAERGDRVTLALSQRCVDSDEFHAHLADLASSFAVELISGKDIDELERVSLAHVASITVVPDGDHTLLKLSFRKRWHGSGLLSLLVMREPVASTGSLKQRVAAIVKSVMFRRTSRHENVLVHYLRSALWRPAADDDGMGVPDLASFAADAQSIHLLREQWTLDERFWFGVIGAIDERKNLALVLDALRNEPSLRTCGLLVAGKCGDGILDGAARARAAFESRGGRVVVIDRTLQSWELDAAVAAVDCVVLAHSNEGPSGILAKAVLTGTRIATAGAGSLRAEAARLAERATWSDLDVPSLGGALARAARLPRPAPIALDSSIFADRLLATT